MHFAVFAVVGKNPEHKDTGVLPQPTDKPIVEPPIPPAYGKKKINLLSTRFCGIQLVYLAVFELYFRINYFTIIITGALYRKPVLFE